MPRKSKIESSGIGDKVIGYHLAGMSAPEIAVKIAAEHEGITLTDDQVLRFVKQHSALLNEKKAIARDTSALWSLDEIRKQLMETVNDVREYINRHEDNPRAVAAFLKVKIDALDKITKMLGGYPSEQPTVNLQVNNVYTRETFEKTLKDAEEYFKMIDAEVIDATADP